MASINLTFNACGGSANAQKIYYGKTNIVTGTPLSGTGWTLHTGAALPPSATSANIGPLDDNVDYTVYRYCSSVECGDVGPEVSGPFIKNVCPGVPGITPGSTNVSYSITVPPSVNNPGTWITRFVVELLNDTATTVLQSNVTNSAVPSTVVGNFTGLTSSTNYKLRIKYTNTAGTRSYICSTHDFQTQAACVAPTLTLNNVTSTSMDVTYSVAVSYVGDTYNIILNGTTIASGLGLGSSPYPLTGLSPDTFYTVQVQRNCGFGGTATATANATTASDINMSIQSSLGGSIINSITGISGFTLPAPIVPGSNTTGTHNAFTGVIAFTISQAPAIDGNATLKRNGVYLQCMNIPMTTGSYSFNSQSFTATDFLEVDFNTGNCPP